MAEDGRWRYLVLGILVIAMVQGWVSRGHWKGVAQAEASANERRDSVIRLQERELEAAAQRQIELRDSLDVVTLADSAEVMALRSSRAAARAVADSLDAELAVHLEADSTRVALLEQRLALQVRETERADSVAAVERRRRVRAELFACPGCNSMIDLLLDRVDLLETQIAGKDRQIVALENAAGDFTPFSFEAGPWLGAAFSLGAAVGAIASR